MYVTVHASASVETNVCFTSSPMLVDHVTHGKRQTRVFWPGPSATGRARAALSDSQLGWRSGLWLFDLGKRRDVHIGQAVHNSLDGFDPILKAESRGSIYFGQQGRIALQEEADGVLCHDPAISVSIQGVERILDELL
mmetsp:Transcript_80658/g.133293  ORF Transcript_80658/g.133293 Transcript_80658/m.133293 type:complete len:138 (-) Transcript_80658:911-1324(-)